MIGTKKVAVLCPHTLVSAWDDGSTMDYDVVYVALYGGGQKVTPQQLKAAISLQSMGITVSMAQGERAFEQIEGFDRIDLCPICTEQLGFEEKGKESKSEQAEDKRI